MVTTAREIMTQDAQCVKESQTLVDAARRMRDLDVGALPICGDDDDRLKGMITDRDIVADGTPVTIGADDPVHEVLETMAEYQVRRLPVIDGHRLVGIISEADIARYAPDEDVADTIHAVTQ